MRHICTVKVKNVFECNNAFNSLMQNSQVHSMEYDTSAHLREGYVSRPKFNIHVYFITLFY